MSKDSILIKSSYVVQEEQSYPQRWQILGMQSSAKVHVLGGEPSIQEGCEGTKNGWRVPYHLVEILKQ